MPERAASRGYLERIAAGAMSPARAIHPVSSPVVANPSFHAEPPSSEWPEPSDGAETHPEATRAAPKFRPEAPSFARAAGIDTLLEPLVAPAAPGPPSPHEEEPGISVPARAIIPGRRDASTARSIVSVHGVGTDRNDLSDRLPSNRIDADLVSIPPAASASQGMRSRPPHGEERENSVPARAIVSDRRDPSIAGVTASPYATGTRRNNLSDRLPSERIDADLVSIPPAASQGVRSRAPHEEEHKTSIPASALVLGQGDSSITGARTDRNEAHVETGLRTEAKTALVDRRPVSITSEGAMGERWERKERQEFPDRSQPGEVQIHIGRIEVTAIPPAAPAMHRPPRTTLRLIEYLKRGRRDS